jgi:hypothetical protein
VKTCFKCGREKSIDDFYRHPAMADGRLGKCKDCTKHDMRVDRQTKPRVREYDRERAKQPHRVALAKRITREWRQKHRDRARAQQMAEKHHIEQPELCEACGLRKPLEKHHPDYSKPLLVLWLCKPCHAIADKIRRRLESA